MIQNNLQVTRLTVTEATRVDPIPWRRPVFYLVFNEKCPWSEHYGVFGATRLGEEPVLSLPKESVPEGARLRCLRPLGRVRKIERLSLRRGQKLCTEGRGRFSVTTTEAILPITAVGLYGKFRSGAMDLCHLEDMVEYGVGKGDPMDRSSESRGGMLFDN